MTRGPTLTRRAVHISVMIAAAATCAVVAPSVATARAPAVAPPTGSSSYVAVTPARLADTRAGGLPAGGYTRVDAQTIRVQVAGRGAIPANATAAVLNITSVGAAAAAFVTAYPSGQPRPTAAVLNVDTPDQIIANLATVRLGATGAVDLYSNQPMDLVIDVSGAYTAVTDAVSSGRLVVLSGDRRVLDTRDTRTPFSAGETRQVDLTVNRTPIPVDATAAVVNLAAVDAKAGFWTAFPPGPRPLVSNLSIDAPEQTRNAQAIVSFGPGTSRSISVFSLNGGDLVVDVVGYFTGASAAASTDGLFIPWIPMRVHDTRSISPMPPWGGSTIEFMVGADRARLAEQVAAVSLNVAVTDPLNVGFVTAHPAGVARPLAANVNVTKFDQIISNHAIVRVGSRNGGSVSLFTQSGAHLVADVTGWYLGSPDPSTLAPPANPSTGPTTAVHIDAPTGSISVAVGAVTGTTTVEDVLDAGFAVLAGGTGQLGTSGPQFYAAHRTAAGGPFYFIEQIQEGDTFTITGADGRTFKYLATITDVTTTNDVATLAKIAATAGPITVTLVSHHPLHSSRMRIFVVGRLIGLG